MAHISEIEKIERDAETSIGQAGDLESLEELRIKYLGRKGLIQEFFKTLPAISPEERPLFGQKLNALRDRVTRVLAEKKETLNKAFDAGRKGEATFDVTLPGRASVLGARHPITQVIEEICGVFLRLGFKIVEGPEIESEYYNFEALNIPLDHPSRDAFDTFYVEGTHLLRSQTSTVQIRAMEKTKPPLQIIAPGKVYRPDAIDASHSFMFHQIEGLMVDRDIKFSDLKGVLYTFCREIFGKDIKMRFRPHFFPFTEPSVEVDISWRKGWLEILGAGMVNPKVFQAVGISPKKYNGFAFGLGIERIAMLKYGIQDIRSFCENDLRFLKQFG